MAGGTQEGTVLQRVHVRSELSRRAGVLMKSAIAHGNSPRKKETWSHSLAGRSIVPGTQRSPSRENREIIGCLRTSLNPSVAASHDSDVKRIGDGKNSSVFLISGESPRGLCPELDDLAHSGLTKRSPAPDRSLSQNRGGLLRNAPCLAPECSGESEEFLIIPWATFHG